MDPKKPKIIWARIENKVMDEQTIETNQLLAWLNWGTEQGTPWKYMEGDKIQSDFQNDWRSWGYLYVWMYTQSWQIAKTFGNCIQFSNP